MCGIVGFVGKERSLSCNLLKKSVASLRYRGPDDYGVWFEEFDELRVGLGHARLSIVDLTNTGKQPLEYKNLRMVYNGEVYNYEELKSELISFGYSFKGTSDSEVVLKAIHYWGLSQAVTKFQGMFAISIFDSSTGTLNLIRDRLGVKPLFYYLKDGLIYFSSELKAIMEAPFVSRQLSNVSVAKYLKFGYVPQPNTIYKNIYKLSAGEILSYRLSNGAVTIDSYWNYSNQVDFTKSEESEDTLVQELHETIVKSVKKRMAGDVEVGCFLSGGYDSSIVASILAKELVGPIKTFTIGFNEEVFDESNFARKISKIIGSEHYERIITPEDCKKMLSSLPFIWDEPMADTSVFPTIMASRLAGEHVKVVLSADGGDELFAGYDSYYRSLKMYKYLRLMPFRRTCAIFLRSVSNLKVFRNIRFFRRLRRLSYMIASTSPLDIKNSFQMLFDDEDVDNLLSFNVDKSALKSIPSVNLDKLNSVDKMLVHDIYMSHVDQLLVKVDRATMAASVEGREPLLDLELLEFSAKLRPEYKIKGNTGKYLLKELGHRLLGKDVLDRRKKGFSIPLKSWLSEDFNQLVFKYLSKEKLSHGIFNIKEIEEIVENYKRDKNVNYKQIWALVCFQMWYEKWVD